MTDVGRTPHEEALRLFTDCGVFGVPIKVTHYTDERGETKKKIRGLVRWREGGFYDGPRDDSEFMRAWDGNEDAPALGIFVGKRAGLCALDPDAPEAEEFLYGKKLPRTVSFRSRRGIKRVFRYPEGVDLPNGTIAPHLELRSEFLLIVPPSEGYEYLPSMALGELDLAPLPEWARRSAENNGRRRGQVEIRTGSELPPGQAHDRMLRIVGKLARTLPLEDLWNTARGLNQNRLPEDELRRMVEDIASKEHPPVGAELEPPPEVREPTGEPRDLAEVHEAFRRGLYLPDPTVVDVTLAATVANLLPVDPVFLMVVGAGSRGKTEPIDAQRDIPQVHALSSLTKATLFSGFRDPKQPGKDHSLLPRLSRRGVRVLTLKDFGTVIAMHRNERGEVLAQLREMFDGSFVKETGTGQQIAWEGHMGFVAGATPAIDGLHGVLSILGERFVYLRIPDVDRSATTKVALGARGRDQELRQERRRVVAEFVAGLNLDQAPDLTDGVRQRIISLADFTTRVRTGVDRDGYSREVLALPELEAPMRLAKQLASLWSALRLIGYDERRALAMLGRLAADSIPPVRRVCLEYLRNNGRSQTRPMAQELGLPTNTASRGLEDLALLGVVKRDREGTADNAPNWWEILLDFPGSSPEMSGGSGEDTP